MEQTVPPITNGEYEFFEKQKLCDAYNEDKNFQTTMVEPLVDSKGEQVEPELHFHEFLFILGLIAKNCVNSTNDDSIQSKLKELFDHKLEFRKVSEFRDIDLSYEEVLFRVYNHDFGKGQGESEGESGDDGLSNSEES